MNKFLAIRLQDVQDFLDATQAVIQVLACQHGGETPGNVYPSFSASMKCKRKMTHILFDSKDEKPDDVHLLAIVKATLKTHGLTDVIVGWEHTFLLPEDSNIIAFDCMDWIRNDHIMSLLCEVVAVSPFKAIIKTNPATSFEQLKKCFITHNASHKSRVHKLFGFDGKFIWHEHVQRATDVDSLNVPLSIDISLQNASSKECQRLIPALLSAAQTKMSEAGFDFGNTGIIPEWASMNRRRATRVCAVFPNVLVARAFHYQYKDMEWESASGTQTMIIRLKHDIFDNELLDPRIRVAVSTSTITPAMISAIRGVPLC